MIEQDNNETERELRGQFEKAECKPFSEKLGEIRHRLIRREEKPVNDSSKRMMKRNRLIAVLSIAASFVLLFGIGLAVYLTDSGDSEDLTPGVTSYEDKDIEIVDYTESAFMELSVYRPELSILTEKVFEVGVHKNSYEHIYYKISGKYGLNTVDIRIIAHAKYHPVDEADYGKTDTVNVNGKAVSYGEYRFENSVYLYKLGFETGNYRYYTDYRTPEQDSYVSFLEAFIC